MSEQNVQIVRILHASFGTREHEAVFAHYAADIEWDIRDIGLVGVAGIYCGHEGVRRFWRNWLSAWKEIVAEDYRFYDAGDDDVVVTWRQRMTGRHSDLVASAAPGMIWTLREGKVVRMRFFTEGSDALAAAGIAPPAPPDR